MWEKPKNGKKWFTQDAYNELFARVQECRAINMFGIKKDYDEEKKKIEKWLSEYGMSFEDFPDLKLEEWIDIPELKVSK